MRDENINISDVIEVIETDPDFKKSPQATMYGGAANNSPINPAQIRRQAAIRIVEQPASKALRFRYECEGRSAGSIPGASSTAENKTYPSIQIVGYKGKAVVVVSCVTKDKPYRPHPHNLVGREGCRRGVCTLEIPPDTMSITFSNLGIQCVKKKDIEAHLRVREEIRVDPFKTGFSHRTQPTTIDLNAVRLCFQVFIEGNTPGKFTVPLDPVVSDPIYDKKAMCDLVIVKLSDCVSPVDGGRKDIILLCEKVAKEDIQVRFYEEKDGVVLWEGFGDFQPSQVHKQTAIWFKTPRYMKLDITEPVRVNIQLRRPSDGATSEPLPFELLPLDSGRPSFWSIRRNFAKKSNYSIFNTLLANDAELLRKRQLEELPAVNVQNDSVGNEVRQVTDTQGVRRKRKYEPDPNSNLLRQEQDKTRDGHGYNLMNNIPVDIVKVEPIDSAQAPYVSPHYHGNLSPMYAPNPHSPHYLPPTMSPNIGHTPPPPQELQFNITYPANNNLNPITQTITLPPINVLQNNGWNIGTANVQDAGASAMSIDSVPGISSLLDLDNQQVEPIVLNSEELRAYNNFDPANLSENLSNNLSISDVPRNANMTDSLTRLAQTTYDNMCNM